MDCATTNQILFDCLIKLRQENRLLTENEFQNLHANQVWFEKEMDFTRIPGRDYILQITKNLNLKYIKVPEKKVVIKANREILSFEIGQYGNGNLVKMISEDIVICAQKIQKVDRLLSREEMTELFTIIAVANFSDLCRANFIVAEDGIYFIDTEIKSFCNIIEWGKMVRLAPFMAKEDQDWFIQQIKQKFKDQECAEP